MLTALRQFADRLAYVTGMSAPDLSPADRAIMGRVSRFTLSGRARLASLLTAVEHVVRAQIPGAIVECGVWEGGSMMAAALKLLDMGGVRDLYLYDTFSGMTAPSTVDRDLQGRSAGPRFDALQRAGKQWTGVPRERVRANLASTGWPMDRAHLVEGPVETTIPGAAPAAIAVLRLDTDFYESTRHELEHLYPLLSPGGVLIIDDYGHWQGARKAVDEYFAGTTTYLHRVDYTARLVVKPPTRS